MGSSLRNFRDTRYTPRTYRDHRAETQGGTKQKTYDTRYTLKSNNTDMPKGHPSRTDHKVDHVHEIARDQLIPQIKKMSSNAVLTDRREFYYYARKRTGRRCSCYLYETSQRADCVICLGTGIVGGYEKYGTKTEVIDFTLPLLSMVNVEPNFDEDTRPIYFRLIDGSKKGIITGELPINQNIGLIDTMLISQPVFNRNIKVFAKDPTGSEKEIVEKEDLEDFLAYDRVQIRIEITDGVERPYLSHFMMRYKTKEDPIVFGDIPRSQEEFQTLGPSGIIDFYNEIQIFFDTEKLQNIQNEDILYRLQDGRRFKIINVNKNVIINQLTSTDTGARFLIPDVDHGAMNLLV